MILRIKPARQDDISQLAEMNHQLIADEESRNPMTVDQLALRMSSWLERDWVALLVIVDGSVVGYMLYQERGDDYFPNKREVYIRHYFIKREMRRKGIGKRAFDMIISERLPKNVTLTLEVLAQNDIAKEFWASVGFQAYRIALRRESSFS